jgi:hypothetical protein
MWYKDHNPPHFHAEYGEYNAMFNFDGEIIDGDFPANKKKLISAWAEIHKEELEANWKLAKSRNDTFMIAPLK